MTYKGFATGFGSRNDETYIHDIVKRNEIWNIAEMEALPDVPTSAIGALTNQN